MNPVQRKTSLRSTTIFGLSVVKLIFEDGVEDTYARQQVNNLMHDADLPDNVDPDVQPPTGPTGEVYRYTLESSFRDPRELKTIQDWVVDREICAPSRASPTSSASAAWSRPMRSRSTRMVLANLGITPLDVYNAVGKSNINIGGDIIKKNSQAYVVRGHRPAQRYQRDQEYHHRSQQRHTRARQGRGGCQRSATCPGWAKWRGPMPSTRQATASSGTTRMRSKGIVLMRKGENPDRGDQGNEDGGGTAQQHVSCPPIPNSSRFTTGKT